MSEKKDWVCAAFDPLRGRFDVLRLDEVAARRLTIDIAKHQWAYHGALGWHPLGIAIEPFPRHGIAGVFDLNNDAHRQKLLRLLADTSKARAAVS